MAASTDTAQVAREGAALRFSGRLLRAAVPALWSAAAHSSVAGGVQRLDLTAVERIDSAGLALLVELAARTGADDVIGNPPGLAQLRAAYRLSPTLTFAHR